ncbi:MAG: sensor histidine kinase [Rubripirellula sp.]
MRLAAKLVLLFLFGLLLIVGVFSYLTIRQDQLAQAEHQRFASELVKSLEPTIEKAIRDDRASEIPMPFQRSPRLERVTLRWVELSPIQDASRQPAPLNMIIAQRELTTVRMPDRSGEEFVYTYVPFTSRGPDGTKAGKVEVATPDTGSNDRFRRSLMTSLVALLGVATLSGLVILVGGIRMVGKPLNELIDKVHRVGEGDFSGPVQLDSKDELGRLGSALNEMCDQLVQQRHDLESATASRIETVEQLRHAERLNTVGRMAAGIAHEVGTPLNVVTGRAELIASGELTTEATRDSALAIHSEAQRITKIVRELLDFARQSTPQRSNQNLNDLVKVTFNLMEPLAGKHHTSLSIDLPDQELDANIDAGQIQQVLTNLVVNAIQSTGEDGNVKIGLESTQAIPPHHPTSSAKTYRRITISDDGEGIEEADLAHIFEPFYTTKDVGEGTGLGLSISHGIVQEHDGWIDAQSQTGHGSTFAVYLPATEGTKEPIA